MGRDAVSIKANTFQFFTRNPRGGRAKDIRPDDAAALRQIMSENDIALPMAHAPYTLNLCAAKENLRIFALETMADDLNRLQTHLPGAYYNLHPGSHVGQGTEKGIELIAAILNQVIQPQQSTLVLLETMSGQGSEVGGNFTHLQQIIEQVEFSEFMGVCLDTCHVWAAGYDIVNKLDEVLIEFDKSIGLQRLKAIHLNDSQGQLGNHKDRHALLGEGAIGMEGIKRIIHHAALKHLPFYLETPNELPGYGREIEMLRNLYSGLTLKC